MLDGSDARPLLWRRRPPGDNSSGNVASPTVRGLKEPIDGLLPLLWRLQVLFALADLASYLMHSSLSPDSNVTQLTFSEAVFRVHEFLTQQNRSKDLRNVLNEEKGAYASSISLSLSPKALGVHSAALW